MVERYGDFVVYKPPVKHKDLFFVVCACIGFDDFSSVFVSIHSRKKRKHCPCI
jgi:cytochrome c-type biogenesis protein CcmH/NrfF